MRLILLGPPGAGKGTQSERMCRRYGLAALSSGDILRAQIRENTEVGKTAAGLVEAGALVPDDVITAVMLAGIAEVPESPGFILDGYPRTVAQAESLEAGLASSGASIDVVLEFSMDDRLIVERIVNRRTCEKCGATYNLKFLPPGNAGICDQCGESLVQRADDREDVIVTRLDTYRAETAPLVQYYAGKGLLESIDASGPADEVEREVSGIVDRLCGSA